MVKITEIEDSTDFLVEIEKPKENGWAGEFISFIIPKEILDQLIRESLSAISLKLPKGKNIKKQIGV